MLTRRLDLPLERDATGRFLPWIVALMVYLAALALAGMMALTAAVEHWDRGVAGTLTVQLPPAASDRLDAVVRLLRDTPGVVSAAPLDNAATAALLEPWLGPARDIADLPLPRLIDVRIDIAAGIDIAGLKSRIAATAPGAVLDDHRLWVDRLLSIAFAVEATAAAIVLLIGAAAVLTVIFTTRTGLSIHHGVVELLHLMGARDNYIASQFEWQALRLGLRGGLAGLVPAVLTLLAIGHAIGAGGIIGDVRLLPALHLSALQWVLLALLPVVAGTIAMLTARLTVLRALARMP